MNKIKRIAKSWALMNAVFIVLVCATRPAAAADGLDLDSFINALPAGWASGVTAVFIVLYAVAQLRALLPPSVTSKIPTVIMKLLDFVAANYAHARNAPPETDAKTIQASNAEYRSIVETAKNNGELRSGNRIESAGTNPGVNRPGSKKT